MAEIKLPRNEAVTEAGGSKFSAAWNIFFSLLSSEANTVATPVPTWIATEGNAIFPATQVPSADPNTLDDYEEGSFTPSLKFGGASVGMTYGTQQGHYTKIGRQVFISIKIVLTAKGSSTGDATISGLPFTASSNNATADAVSFLTTTSVGNTMMLTMSGSVSEISLQFGSVGGLIPLTHSNINNTTTLTMSFAYFV